MNKILCIGSMVVERKPVDIDYSKSWYYKAKTQLPSLEFIPFFKFDLSIEGLRGLYDNYYKYYLPQVVILDLSSVSLWRKKSAWKSNLSIVNTIVMEFSHIGVQKILCVFPDIEGLKVDMGSFLTDGFSLSQLKVDGSKNNKADIQNRISSFVVKEIYENIQKN